MRRATHDVGLRLRHGPPSADAQAGCAPVLPLTFRLLACAPVAAGEETSKMNAACVLRPRHTSATAVRHLELTGQLRTAVMDGDEARIARLLSELLRVKGLTKGQRVALQLKALQ